MVVVYPAGTRCPSVNGIQRSCDGDVTNLEDTVAAAVF